MGVSATTYQFLLVDIGDSGRQSDGNVYHNSYLGHAIENNLIGMPERKALPNSTRVLPYVFIGDDAFGLKPHMMKPYPNQFLPIDQRIFNYRLSRARRVVENAFGIATTRFRIFRRPIIAAVEKVVAVTKAVVALHNYLLSVSNAEGAYQYCPRGYADGESRQGVIEGEWRAEAAHNGGLLDIPKFGSNNYSLAAGLVRDQYKEYLNNEGAVDWQLDIVTCTSAGEQ